MGGGTDACGPDGSTELYKGDISDYTPEELVRIANFVSLLSDVGIAAFYTLEAASTPGDAHELVIGALTAAMGDLKKTCGVISGVATTPEDIHEAAPSLVVLTDFWPDEISMPDDFEIGEELREKCFSKFYEYVRVRVASAASEAASAGAAE